MAAGRFEPTEPIFRYVVSLGGSRITVYPTYQPKASLGDGPVSEDQRVTLSQIATRIPLGNQWSVIGMWSKNHTLDRQVESIAGLELDSCCTRFSIAYRQFSDPKLSLDPDSKTLL